MYLKTWSNIINKNIVKHHQNTSSNSSKNMVINRHNTCLKIVKHMVKHRQKTWSNMHCNIDRPTAIDKSPLRQWKQDLTKTTIANNQMLSARIHGKAGRREIPKLMSRSGSVPNMNTCRHVFWVVANISRIHLSAMKICPERKTNGHHM
jgi:hypothetical protein